MRAFDSPVPTSSNATTSESRRAATRTPSPEPDSNQNRVRELTQKFEEWLLSQHTVERERPDQSAQRKLEQSASETPKAKNSGELAVDEFEKLFEKNKTEQTNFDRMGYRYQERQLSPFVKQSIFETKASDRRGFVTPSVNMIKPQINRKSGGMKAPLLHKAVLNRMNQGGRFTMTVMNVREWPRGKIYMRLLGTKDGEEPKNPVNWSEQVEPGTVLVNGGHFNHAHILTNTAYEYVNLNEDDKNKVVSNPRTLDPYAGRWRSNVQGIPLDPASHRDNYYRISPLFDDIKERVQIGTEGDYVTLHAKLDDRLDDRLQKNKARLRYFVTRRNPNGDDEIVSTQPLSRLHLEDEVQRSSDILKSINIPQISQEGNIFHEKKLDCHGWVAR